MPLKLFMPTYIPPSLKYDGIDADMPPEVMTGVPKGKPWRGELYFTSANIPPPGVVILETSLDLNPNNAAGTPTVMPANGVVATIEVDGTTVTRHDVANQDGKVISLYYWKQSGTTMQLMTFPRYGPSEQEIEKLIVSTLGG